MRETDWQGIESAPLHVSRRAQVWVAGLRPGETTCTVMMDEHSFILLYFKQEAKAIFWRRIDFPVEARPKMEQALLLSVRALEGIERFLSLPDQQMTLKERAEIISDELARIRTLVPGVDR